MISNIPIKNITSGAANIMGKKNDCLKLMKEEDPEILLMHCVIRMENLVAKNISPVPNEVLRSIIKCINAVSANSKYEHLQLFWEKQNADHLRLLLHNEIRWLSKENCMKRFIKLFDTLISYKPE